MAGERAKDNKTLTSTCASCGKNSASALLTGLKGVENGKRKIFAVCTACRDKGWRPPGYSGF
ncbi:MAG: hypothetical protein QOD06_2196 [Candidatus Binatota bacterium]|jgi:hypothetical protein|nr:hypothetical protein [Candidatus Binatota bacterium]